MTKICLPLNLPRHPSKSQPNLLLNTNRRSSQRQHNRRPEFAKLFFIAENNFKQQRLLLEHFVFVRAKLAAVRQRDIQLNSAQQPPVQLTAYNSTLRNSTLINSRQVNATHHPPPKTDPLPTPHPDVAMMVFAAWGLWFWWWCWWGGPC